MQYIQWTISKPIIEPEHLIAALWEYEILGLEEADDALLLYARPNTTSIEEIQMVLQNHGCKFTTVTSEDQNWNALWEASFTPIVIDNFCAIRAHFHPPIDSVKNEVIITPRMSFGTGHHATTQLMIAQMALLDFNNKNVLDFGTGTGVLAILAEKLGAKITLAIDNDEWSVQNAQDNLILNKTRFCEVADTDIEAISDTYDIILANINRHILVQHSYKMSLLLKKHGTLLLSGILEEDEPIMRQALEDQRLKIIRRQSKNNWLCMSVVKSTS